MALWEKREYARPGDALILKDGHRLTRPLMMSSDQTKIIDDPKIEEMYTCNSDDRLLIVATFPEGVSKKKNSRGCIVLVPNRGLRWLTWP